MADLSWPRDILIIAGVGTVGFMLLSYWFSGVMARRSWNLQINRSKRRKKQDD